MRRGSACNETDGELHAEGYVIPNSASDAREAMHIRLSHPVGNIDAGFEMILTYKYRLKGKRAARQLRRYAWAVNQVWNFCVQTQKTTQRRYRDGLKPKWPSQYELQALTVGTSVDLGVHAQSVQGTCEQFTKSRDLHRKCPNFRRSGGQRRSLGWIPFPKQGRQLNGNSIIYLGNTYRFFGSKRRPLPAIIKGGVFVEDARGRWWVCFHVGVEDLANAVANEAVGIDLGLKTLATLSTGEKIDNPQTYRKWEGKLAVAQRAGNHTRAKAINAKIANVRRDHMHKATSKIAAQYSFIAVGNISSSQLVKTRMAKSVLDAGWSAFRNAFRYKASRHGGTFLEVDERFTSQTCSTCGEQPPSRPRGIAGLGIREWACSSCGSRHDRDVNAAKNILKLGLSALASNQPRGRKMTRQPRVDESRVAHGR
jgi:IS605 OrfB family transposase